MKPSFSFAFLLSVFLINVLFVACASADSQSERCEVDSDCVVVQDGCCSCSYGGRQKSVAKDDYENYLSEHKAQCGVDIACAAVISNHWSCQTSEAVCKKGACELVKPQDQVISGPLGIDTKKK